MTGRDEQTGLDVERLFRALGAYGVDYVVIGGVAANLHGTSRMTSDCDIVIDQDAHNLQRMVSALGALRARGRSARLNLEESNARSSGSQDQGPIQRHPGELQQAFLNVDTDAGPLDILPYMVIGEDEQLTYRELEPASTLVSAGAAGGDGEPRSTVVIKIASIDHLVRAKTYIDRPHDRDDVAELTTIRKRGRSLGYVDRLPGPDVGL